MKPTRGNKSSWCHSTLATTRRALITQANGVRENIAQAVVEQLPALQEFKPATATVTFTGVPSKPNLTLVLDPRDKLQEIYELNPSVIHRLWR